ncbi:MAG: 30S ribosomal protein S8 [Bacilli bacterium]|jgi:small subunit ribosomal protein S8|nr:30S ribosomal protein S8 [Bacilli bacterium]
MNADPIADMLTRIRNANALHYDTVSMPYSKMKNAIAEILHKEGFLSAVATDGEGAKKQLTLTIKYGPVGEKVINGLRRISKPGLRVTVEANKLPRVIGGLGIAIISTSKGLLTDAEARKAKVGGEVICYVW